MNDTPETLTAHVGYAYQLRQSDRSISRDHAVLEQPLTVGRLVRKRGDALCRPRRKFWGLESVNDQRNITCPTCVARAERYGVTIRPLTTTGPWYP
ncbi:hypothetical protein KGD82_16665 [Nocardiopsis eucommiae]|uniref:Uncharacterized protein n=1 Tax=Nocardiopsis eucommiae TaxID=2831970 RepID=A0A975L7Y9_9ACTN|nr:hypothetical protein KGD82_16665 [Nocardiopsis eucommiae]